MKPLADKANTAREIIHLEGNKNYRNEIEIVRQSPAISFTIHDSVLVTATKPKQVKISLRDCVLRLRLAVTRVRFYGDQIQDVLPRNRGFGMVAVSPEMHHTVFTRRVPWTVSSPRISAIILTGPSIKIKVENRPKDETKTQGLLTFVNPLPVYHKRTDTIVSVRLVLIFLGSCC